MFESWHKCPVLFSSLGGKSGLYDREKDVIVLDISVPVNPLLTYLTYLFVRDYEGKTKEWVADQATMVWNTMSTVEIWELGNAIFNSITEEK